MMMAHQLDGVLCTSYKQRICSNKEKIMMEHTAGNYNLIIITYKYEYKMVYKIENIYVRITALQSLNLR